MATCSKKPFLKLLRVARGSSKTDYPSSALLGVVSILKVLFDVLNLKIAKATSIWQPFGFFCRDSYEIIALYNPVLSKIVN